MDEERTQRPLGFSLGLIVITAAAGLAVRFAGLGLPAVMVKYGGSALWALMLYWIVSAALASWRPMPIAGVTGGLATAVEFFKLYHVPGLDAFRHTLAGVLLLGRIFSVWDIGIYWTAVVGGALLDGWLRRSVRDR